MSDPIEHFRLSIVAAGLEAPPYINADGAIHRYSTDGNLSHKNGWYFLHLDGIPWGQAGCWNVNGGDPVCHWCAKSDGDMTAAELDTHRKRIRATQVQREADLLATQQQASETAVKSWGQGDAVTAHPYLNIKGVQPFGLRVFEDKLLIPLCDPAGNILSLQTIAPDGNKRFLAGGRVKGCYHAIGSLAGVLIVCEGYATGASLHEATGHAVAVTFHAGNLEAVALALRAKCPALKIIVAADDDHQIAGNPGLCKATAAALAVGGLLAVPVFAANRPDKATDFNDLHQLSGLQAVRHAIEAAALVLPKIPAPALSDGALISQISLICAAAEKGDVGRPFEPDALDLLRQLKDHDIAGWVRTRERLKKAGVGIKVLDQQMNANADACGDDQNVADKLIDLARSRCVFMHDAQREAFAVFDAAGARQVYALASSGFSEFLTHAYYSEHDRAPNDAALKVALSTLRGQAQFEGDECEVFTRIAKTDTGYWLDLCNDAWEAVQITATGWAVMAGAGVPLFTRSPSMRPLPMPQSGDRLDELWPLVNVPTEDRLMIVAWLIECLRPDTPHVVLELIGEQGSAKSSSQRFLRRLIDPNQADLRGAPKSVEDVWIAARNSHMVSLENLSHLAPAYQDALCMLATGGGYSTRTYYTNAEETILELRKPIVLNGIAVIVTAQDLLDRTVHIDLPAIQSRALLGDIESRFDSAQPKLIGALLDLFVKTLAKLPSVQIDPEDRPRMADFATLGEAVFQVHGKDKGVFLSHYNAMRKEGVVRTIDASPVGAALTTYLHATNCAFEGKLSELLKLLERYRPSGEAWPQSAKGLGDALRRLAPALRLIGYECKSLPKTGGDIRWVVGRAATKSPDPSPASPASPVETLKTAKNSTQSGHAGHAGHEGHRLESYLSARGVSPEADPFEDEEVF